MIEIADLTYRYPTAEAAALRSLSLSIPEGEFVLVAGESGSGKSTLLRALNGLVPHFYGGRISGRIRVAGCDPVSEGPGQMSGVVGFVFQDPESQVVADVVEDELAFAMENAGLSQQTMRKRIEEVADQLDIGHLRGRRVSTLSGGERQRVAIAAVLTLEPRVLVLDEPTSQLDPRAAEEVLDTLVGLNRDLRLTVVLSEHRLERVVQHVDRMIYLAPSEPGTPTQVIDGPPAEVLAHLNPAPPLAQVAMMLKWSPPPLTIRQARLMLSADARFADRTHSGRPGMRETSGNGRNAHPLARRAVLPGAADDGAGTGPSVEVRGAWYSYGRQEALRGVDLLARPGEVLALMGRNGAGKTTLLKLLVGLLKPAPGRVVACGMDTRLAPLGEIVRKVAYLPQRPDMLLFADSVEDEIAFTRRNHGLSLDVAASDALLESLDLLSHRGRDPRDVSVGERQRIALAAVLAADPHLLLLDEPTRGMDYRRKEALAAMLRGLAARGKTIILATHDVELAAQLADRIALMSDGQIAIEGPVREVMSASAIFASQVSQLFRDPALITVEDLQALLRGGVAGHRASAQQSHEGSPRGPGNFVGNSHL